MKNSVKFQDEGINPITASPIRTISPYVKGKENIEANIIASNKRSFSNIGQMLQFSSLDNNDAKYSTNQPMDANINDQSLEFKLLRMSKELE